MKSLPIRLQRRDLGLADFVPMKDETGELSCRHAANSGFGREERSGDPAPIGYHRERRLDLGLTHRLYPRIRQPRRAQLVNPGASPQPEGGHIGRKLQLHDAMISAVQGRYGQQSTEIR